MTSYRLYAFLALLALAVTLLWHYYLNFLPYPFKYIKRDDYYSYIVRIDGPDGVSRVVIPFGVFSVKRRSDNQIHIARMKVSIVDCPLINGKKNEGTVYHDEIEYWLLDKNNYSVTGPLEEKKYRDLLQKKGLSDDIPSRPFSYDRYINNIYNACN